MSIMRIDDKAIFTTDIFETVIENFPDIIHSVDTDGRIVMTNKAAEQLLGYTKDELLGMDVRKIYADEILREMEKGFAKLKQTGEKTVESILKDKQGNRIPVEIRSFSIYDDKGQFVRTFSVLRDIRRIKELEQGMIHAERLAAVGELASGILHDVNNPVAVIGLNVELMNRQLSKVKDGKASAEAAVESVHGSVKDIDRATEAIRKLTSHLMSFTRGTPQDEKEKIDLRDAVEDALFLLKNKILRNHVEVDQLIVPGHHFVMGTRNSIEQVFANILSNACDAMAERPVKRVTIKAKPDIRGEVLCWRVDLQDTGPGIADDIREKIFHPFFTTKPRGKGTGLGLSIAMNVMANHKGSIELHSTMGEGSTFSVIFPQG
jgi:PAS domain S-box-containing protein